MLSIVFSQHSWAATSAKTHIAPEDPHTKQDLSFERIIQEKNLKVCSDAGFLPFEMKNQKGDWIGFDIEMMKEFSKFISVKLTMVQINFDGIIPALISGKCDFIAAGMTVTPERKKMLLFSDTTFTTGLTLVLKNTEKNRTHFKTLADLDRAETKIAVKTGYTSDIYLSKELKYAKILRFDQDADLVLAVMQGRSQAFVSDTTYVKLMDKANKDKFILIPTKIVADKFAVSARKEDQALIKHFNAFLKIWKTSGEYDKMKKLYFEDQIWRSQLATSE